MAIKLIDTAGVNEMQIDASGNISVVEGLISHPAAGGYYAASGGPAGIVAAGLAADVSLATIRFAAASIRKAYVTKFRFVMTPATLGAAGGVAGALGIQRFTAATPTGGTARTPSEMNEPLATLSDMTDIRDQATALSVTSVVFGTEIGWSRVPLYVASAGWFEWNYEPYYPIVLQPGDGIALRTRVAMAATQTWVFAYNWFWFER